MKIIIDGFETEKEAKAFISWYVNQGEQDAGNWFEAGGFDKNPNSTPINKEAPYFENKIDKDTLYMKIKME